MFNGIVHGADKLICDGLLTRFTNIKIHWTVAMTLQ